MLASFSATAAASSAELASGPLPNRMVRSASGGKRREEPLITPISVMHRRSFSVAIWGQGAFRSCATQNMLHFRAHMEDCRRISFIAQCMTEKQSGGIEQTCVEPHRSRQWHVSAGSSRHQAPVGATKIYVSSCSGMRETALACSAHLCNIFPVSGGRL